MTDFIEFPKMARLSRECVITEKIDGTNGCIFIGKDGEFLVGSRTRWPAFAKTRSRKVVLFCRRLIEILAAL